MRVFLKLLPTPSFTFSTLIAPAHTAITLYLVIQSARMPQWYGENLSEPCGKIKKEKYQPTKIYENAGNDNKDQIKLTNLIDDARSAGGDPSIQIPKNSVYHQLL